MQSVVALYHKLYQCGKTGTEAETRRGWLGAAMVSKIQMLARLNGFVP